MNNGNNVSSAPVTSDNTEQNNNDNKTNQDISKILLGALILGIVGGVIGSYIASPGGGLVSGGSQTVVVNEESGVIDVVEKTRPAIVSVVGLKDVAANTVPDDLFFFFPFTPPQQERQDTQEQQVSSGTGFFVTSDGIVATNKHVVADETARYKVLSNDGKQYDARVVAKDPVNDLALLKIDGQNFPTLTLGDSNSIQVGQRVVAVGNALGQFTNTVTTGVISGINRSIVATGQFSETSQIEGAIQTDAAINPGNSGGPLLDLAGAVVGINTAISTQGQLIGFAIPVNDLKSDLESYRRNAKIVKPFMGVRYIMITPALRQQENISAQYGALITTGGSQEPAIIPGSPAESAGLQDRDIIIRINGEEINLEHSLGGAIRNLHPGDTISLDVLRDGREIKINLTLGERD